jgi:hypothetical protein
MIAPAQAGAQGCPTPDFAPAVNFGAGDGPRAVAVRDFNLDGKPDLVTANNASNNVSVLLGDGTGGFGAATDLGVGSLPVDARVTLEVYDMLGRRVAQLVDGVSAAGHHDVQFDASSLASGLCIYRINAQGSDGKNFAQVKKLMLMK